MSGHSTSLLRAHWWLPNVLGVNSKVPQWLTKTFTISFKYFSDITSCLRSSRASCHLFTCPSTEFRKATLCSTLGYCHFEDFADVWTRDPAFSFHFHLALGPLVFKQARYMAIAASGIRHPLLLLSSEKIHLWDHHLAASFLHLGPPQRNLLWPPHPQRHLFPICRIIPLKHMSLLGIMLYIYLDAIVSFIVFLTDIPPDQKQCLDWLFPCFWGITCFRVHRNFSVHFYWVNLFLSNTMNGTYLTNSIF